MEKERLINETMLVMQRRKWQYRQSGDQVGAAVYRGGV
jgi:hypothetical protein